MADTIKLEKHTRRKAKSTLQKIILNADIVSDIEAGIHDFACQYCISENYRDMVSNVYQDTLRNVVFNLENRSSKSGRQLRRDVEAKRINAYNLAFMTPDELNSDAWMDIIIHNNRVRERLNNLPTYEWKPCRDCGKRQYSYYQLQTRSADEPMTIFYICKNCNRTYKVNN